MDENALRKLEALGQSVWLDFLSRRMLVSGELQRMIEDGLRGVTSNPAIFRQAFAGDDYDEGLRAPDGHGKSAQEMYETLAVEDVRAAADLFRGLYDRLQGGDGFVSLEVSPHLARDTQGTLAEARRLWTAVDRPNVMIKVPGTREGLPAIRTLTAEGVNVNVTLLFGLPRYREVAEAYIAGLEERAAKGAALDRIASVASFFLSRIDVLLDPRLDAIIAGGGPDAPVAGDLKGEIAIASAKVAYDIYREIFSGARFQALLDRGAQPQRLLWASTGTKNPAYSDVKYVEPLIGPSTVNTMPPETLAAFLDHGVSAPRLTTGTGEARQRLARLGDLHIDLDAATQQLEDEGIEKFIKPFDELLQVLEAKRTALAAPSGVTK